ncbi:serine protease family S08A [Achlya hypogyna]|uniref:subtilisin n=1 Tax=Achlya hypogyna TaxID=1202772 RepID=A0A1V9ZN28_ACHHY|nr:serine protease family S08A [Achlya hypogyna]
MRPLLGCFLLATIATVAATMNLLVHLDDLSSDSPLPLDMTRDGVYEVLHRRHIDHQRLVWDMATTTDGLAADVAAARVTPLWIQNTLIVQNASPALARSLRATSGVRAVESDMLVHLDIANYDSGSFDDAVPDARTGGVESNVKLLHADEAWAKGFTGTGVTIASIDSGVRYSHKVLAKAYRGYVDGLTWRHDYAFWIAEGQNQTLSPDNADEVGHGTHTVGTAVGADGVGIAPGASWIAARPFNADGSAKQSDILLAAQWVMCPTAWDGSKPDCKRGADIVSNSFGGDASITWMDKVVAAWSAAGILPVSLPSPNPNDVNDQVFASGNVNGFQCASVMCPGCLPEAVAVGALVGGTTLWGGSGKGPGKHGAIKPDLVAPGVAIRSAASYDDNKFTRMTGTSMATPHVSGAAAIVLQNGPCRPADLRESLGATAFQKLHKPFLVPSTCGNTSYDEYPNNIYGRGLPDLGRAVASGVLDAISALA